MDIELTVQASYDDGYSFGASYNPGVSDYRTANTMLLNWWNATTLFSFLRFSAVSIPKDAQIISASITLSHSGGFGEVHVYIKCEDEDDSLDLQDPNTLIDNRNMTTASVTWNVTGGGTGDYTSPDISDLITEVTGRAGWVSGNHLSIIMEDFQTDIHNNFHTVDGAATPGKLNVSYISPGQIIGGGII
jgi:hypothetical protein